LTGKRVLICQSRVPFVYGGAELYVEGLSRNVGQAGYEVDVVSLPYEWDPPERILKSCLMWRMLDLDSGPTGGIDLVIATKFPTYAVAHENKVAWLLHQHRSAYDLEGTIYDDFARCESATTYRELIRDADRRFLSECRAVFTISENVSRRLREHCGIESTPLYHPPPLAGRYYSGDYGKDILVVGRLEPLKRVDLAIAAMKFVQTPGAVLRVVGRGFLERQLKDLAAAEGISDRVSFEGFVQEDELLSLYSRAGVVVYVPYDEDYGYATLEAFASGRPVVVTDDSGGPLEFVKDGENGLVVPARPADLAAAIDRLLADSREARAFGENGREVVDRLGWAEVIEQLVARFV